LKQNTLAAPETENNLVRLKT